MTGITWTNMKEVMDGMAARQKKLEDVPKTARKMGVLALNEIHPLTHKKSGNWDSSIHAEVKEVGAYKYELWVGSRGAFSGAGYNYGKRQEDLYHPVEVGFFRAWPKMVELWQNQFSSMSGID